MNESIQETASNQHHEKFKLARRSASEAAASFCPGIVQPGEGGSHMNDTGRIFHHLGRKD